MARSIPSTWAERTTLLPAEIVYLCSLDVRLRNASNGGTGKLWTLYGGGPEDQWIGELAHLWQATQIDFQGALRTPPSGKVTAGTCELSTEFTYGKMAVSGDFSIDLEGASGILRICYEGVVSVRGGTDVPLSLSAVTPATLFVSTTQECATPAFRWLTRTQLFGVGRLAFVNEKSAELDLALDLYFDGRQQGQPFRAQR